MRRYNLGHADLVAYQVVFGLGSGGAWQLPYLAAQTVLRGRDVELGSTVRRNPLYPADNARL